LEQKWQYLLRTIYSMNYLNKLGFAECAQSNNCKTLYYIKNPDGSPRWIWNSENTRPDFLKFYLISNFRSKAFSLFIKLIFQLSLQHLFFKKNKINVSIQKDSKLIHFIKQDFALFTGTEGPNRKLVLFSNNLFIKIALNENSSSIIENEKEILLKIKQGNFYETPKVEFFKKGVLMLRDVSRNGIRNSNFSAHHARALNELMENFPVSYSSLNFESFQENLRIKSGISFNKIPKNLIAKLELLGLELSHKTLKFCFAHRDFTPWNCFVNNEKINVYDFELADPQTPFGFDVFHFVMQQAILVDRLSWNEIKPKLKYAFQLLCKENAENENDFNTYLKAYLFTNIEKYITIYSHQPIWHPQINWLFNTWNDALSDLLSEQISHRKLLIGDVFDFLQNETYAAIKFPQINPTQLPELADIDLLLSKKTARNISNFLIKHSLIKQIKIQKQSKMYSVLVLLKDERVLALDLIWKLKRKSLTFLNTENALNNVSVNQFGIKNLNEVNTKSYLKYFYGLNQSQIPIKYNSFFNNKSDEILNYLQLKKEVMNMPENKGFSKIKNQISYLLDAFNLTFQNKGFIITFSGVDGAGKSTVIEHTKELLIKKFRRNVIVIRHRPSLLPILSAWTKGKEKAEQNAANTLPRQGKNKNVLSSLIRFAYYYSDYLFGQFYIKYKYVFRGDIVLYDRYYFDFINDSVRSNLTLPKWITKIGYKFLLKPNFNFFLYANAETILSRKKELDATVINQLTADYIQLFEAYSKNSKSLYCAVENINLNETLNLIISKSQSKLV